MATAGGMAGTPRRGGAGPAGGFIAGCRAEGRGRAERRGRTDGWGPGAGGWRRWLAGGADGVRGARQRLRASDKKSGGLQTALRARMIEPAGNGYFLGLAALAAAWSLACQESRT